MDYSTIVSTRVGVESTLFNFLKGLNDSYMPKTQQQYDDYRRVMHDIICIGISEHQGFDELFNLSKVGLSSPVAELNKLTPDLYEDGQVLRIIEIAVSHDPAFVIRKKNEKYSSLISFLNQHYKRTEFEVIVVDISDSEWLDTMPEIPKEALRIFERSVMNLVMIHTDPGCKRFVRKDDSPFNFKFNFDKSKLKILSAEIGADSLTDDYLSEFYDNLNHTVSKDDTDDKEYMSDLAESILNNSYTDRPFPSEEPIAPSRIEQLFKKNFDHEPNTEKIPKVLQLGSPVEFRQIGRMSQDDILGVFKGKRYHGGYADLISDSISTGNHDSLRLKLRLDPSALREEMLQGPGRKKLIRMENLPAERKAPTHVGLLENHNVILESLYETIEETQYGDYIEGMTYYSDWCSNLINRELSDSMYLVNKSRMASTLMFYQCISKEIVLNSMRRRDKNEYVLCHSQCRDVYFLVAPGPQLRTESNVVFVKIISGVASISHELSRSWEHIGNHYESKWLSVDTDRLKHWARAYDRCVLTFMSSGELLTTADLVLSESIKTEIKNRNFHLLSLIYLENKQLTSTTIQTTRYTFMKSIGDRQIHRVLPKFPKRVASILQSVILQRTKKSLQKTCFCPTSEWLTLSQVKRDEETGQLDDTTTGSIGTIPRIFMYGEDVPVRYSLYEMYICMCYNKDRQNQTQDAMSILKKISKLESSMRKQLSSRSDVEKLNHLWGIHDTNEDIRQCVDNIDREDHYYSRRAVSLGFKLQDNHHENVSPSSGWCTVNKLNECLNKNLSEFATFKASVDKVEKFIDPLIIDEVKKIGNRTKCIELVHSLVSKDGYTMSRDIVEKFSNDQMSYKVFIQIFKKNQIGGVREILILYIVSRILINVIEMLCITCSKADRREILTKGKDKRVMMRGDYESLMSEHPKGKPLLMIRDSHDMSTWCQKFIPTIFQPFYQTHSDQMQDMKEYANSVLIDHCLKEIEFPKHLIKQWILHPEMKHEEPYMQEMKEEFLRTGRTTFTNVSNMGQGILHYNSTVLALACRSFRDRLFNICLKKLGAEKAITWRTKVGSDDVGELICVDLTRPDAMAQARLFGRVTEVSERLHAMECSVKSASGLIMYELNSAFMCNLEVLSPLIKFTLAAVDMIGTDSCTTFVNESYSRIRQLRENGGSSLLCALAHKLNEAHFYEVFRTGEGMTNDTSEILGVDRKLIPYDLGVYPLYDCDIQEVLGSEYYNYRIFKDDRHDPKLFSMMYSTNLNIEEAIISDQDGVLKKNITRISKGAVKQLVRMRERLNLDAETIIRELEKNPLMLIRGPVGKLETEINIASKLYTMGASESLRRTSPAIYLGRIAAFETANAWDVIQSEKKELFSFEKMGMIEKDVYSKIRSTYSVYLKTLYEQSKPLEFESLKGMLFPQFQTYDSCISMVKKFSAGKLARKVMSQAVRTWVINNYNYQYTSSIKQIIETMLGMSEDARQEDVEEMKKFIPYDMSSVESFVNGCEQTNQKPLEVLHYIMRTYKLSNMRTVQSFAVGPNSTSFPNTVKILKKFNHMRNLTFDVDGIDTINEMRPEATRGSRDEFLKFGFNMTMLELQGLLSLPDATSYCEVAGFNMKNQLTTMIRRIKKISGYTIQMRKLLTFLAGKLLDKHEFVRKLLDWTVFIFSYVETQKKVNNRWTGNLRVKVCYMAENFDYVEDSFGKRLEFKDIKSPRDFNDALKILSQSLQGVSYESFFVEGRTRPGDYILNKGIRLSGVTNAWGKRLIADQRQDFVVTTIQTMIYGKFSWQQNKDKSHSLIYSPYRGHSMTVLHMPGNYYPTEVPSSFVCPEELRISGIRLNLLFQNRSWFFDQRMPNLDLSSSVELILTAHYGEIVRTKDMLKLQIRETIDEELNNEEYADDELFSDPYTSTVNLNNQAEELSSETIFQIFSNLRREEFDEVIELSNEKIEDWAEDVADSIDEEPDENLMGVMESLEGVGLLVRSLGASKKKKIANAYSVQNLLRSTAMQSRLLNFCFKYNDISNESKRDLPDYAKHVKLLIADDDSPLDKDYLKDLLELIYRTIMDITGKDKSRIDKVVDKLKPGSIKPIKVLSFASNPEDIEEIDDLFSSGDSDSDDE